MCANTKLSSDSQAIFKLIPKEEQSKLPEDENTPEKRANKLWAFFEKKDNGETVTTTTLTPQNTLCAVLMSSHSWQRGKLKKKMLQQLCLRPGRPDYIPQSAVSHDKVTWGHSYSIVAVV